VSHSRMVWIAFNVDTSAMSNVRVVGRFTASGRSGNDIQAVLADSSPQGATRLQEVSFASNGSRLASVPEENQKKNYGTDQTEDSETADDPEPPIRLCLVFQCPHFGFNTA